MKQHLYRLLAGGCAAALLLSSASALTTQEALSLLEEHFVDPLPDAAYEAETLDELFRAVGDPYTYYMDAESYKAFTDSVEGESKVGIGVAITYDDAGVIISRVIPGGTAEEGGLTAGDIIVAIDGVSCVPGREGDVARIAGPEGTQVVLDVLHADGTRTQYTLIRRGFTVPTTTVGLLENGSGYLDCDSFASNTGETFAQGIDQYDCQTDLWLTDLRDNTGGRVDGAQGAAGVFIGPGFVAWMRNAQGQYFYYANTDEMRTASPTVVLTNLYSASASEIFSSAIKDYGAGIVLGGRTYGKGVAQIVLDERTDPELFHGDALKITAYRYYSAALNTMDCIGTLPTLLVPVSQTNAVALLFHGSPPRDPSGWLRLTLAGWEFFIDVPTAQTDEDGRNALAELFAALPPESGTAVFHNNSWMDLPIPQAAQRLGISYTSRWFTDVAGSPYETALNTMATYDLLRGVGGGAYRPQGTLTRAELCAMLCHILNRISNSEPGYTDVAKDAWYAPYVAKITELGLMTGKGDGQFDPNGLVTHQELATVLGRLSGFLNANCRELLEIAREQAPGEPSLAAYAEWARPAAWTLSKGYRENVNENAAPLFFEEPSQVNPNTPATRAEAGASLFALLTGLGILVY